MGFKRVWYRIVFFQLSLLLASTAFAAVPQGAVELRVGVVLGDPFATKVANDYQGASIALWEAIAEETHWRFRYFSAGNNVDQMLKDLQNSKLDLVIGPISVNQQRMENADFSRPYFINEVGVIIQKQKFQFKSMTRAFVTPIMGMLFLGLTISFVAYLHLFWYFERGIHPEIPLSYREALNKGLWTHLFKRGFSGMPMTLGGRFTLLLWLVCVATLFSSFNASLTSDFTHFKSREFDPINSFQDLTQLHLMGVKGSAGAAMAQDQGLAVQIVGSLAEGLAILGTDPLAGLVYDSVPAKNYINSHGLEKLMLSNYVLGQEEYAFALPYGSPYAKALNIAIVKLQENQAAMALCQKYLGDQAKYCDL